MIPGGRLACGVSIAQWAIAKLGARSLGGAGLVRLAALLTAFGAPAAGQSLTPMHGEILSMSDSFAVSVYPGNPYAQRIVIETKVYDENFAPLAAFVSPAQASVAAGDRRRILVRVPFEGRTQRRIRVCAESVPFPNQPTRMRAQVCGKFFGRRVG
ncbi:MAG: hypothetical protein ACT4OU_06605 [Hyphomicrobium sp.]